MKNQKIKEIRKFLYRKLYSRGLSTNNQTLEISRKLIINYMYYKYNFKKSELK